MPLYYFILKSKRGSIPDANGLELPNDAAAWQHAVEVARELMRNREAETRTWRIQVCDDYLRPRFEVLFATVDETIEQFPRPVRISIRHVARTAAAFNDVLLQTQSTLKDVRQTLARAERLLRSPPLI